MFFPYGTDAPIYYLPIATGAMILACVAAFFGKVWLSAQMDEEQYLRVCNELILLYGHGLRPWQWITSNFMHADLMHLLGNMFSLWAFGLVVEGKIGWWRFLLVFLGIGCVQCAIEQTLMLGADEGGSLGASAMIYGLMAMAMVWAPQNEMQCVWMFMRVGTLDVAISVFVGLCLFLEFATSFLSGLAMSSQVIHLMGAGLGFAVATVMVKRRWVDCEGWDLYSVLAGREGRHSQEKEQENREAEDLLRKATQNRLEAQTVPSMPSAADPLITRPNSAPLSTDDLLFAGDLFAPEPGEEIAQLLASGKAAEAYARHCALKAERSDWVLPESELLRLITLFHQQKQWSASIPPMVEYLKTYRQRATPMRLKLAQILLEVEKKPDKALQVLKPLPPDQLDTKEAQLFQKLRSKAEQR